MGLKSRANKIIWNVKLFSFLKILAYIWLNEWKSFGNHQNGRSYSLRAQYEVICYDLFFCQVLVIIDVKPKDLGLPTEAYISVEEVHDVSHLAVSLGD